MGRSNAALDVITRESKMSGGKEEKATESNQGLVHIVIKASVAGAQKARHGMEQVQGLAPTGLIH